MSEVLTKEELTVLLYAVRALNPREDTIGALMSKTPACRCLSNQAIVNLAAKLEIGDTIEPETYGDW